MTKKTKVLKGEIVEKKVPKLRKKKPAKDKKTVELEHEEQIIEPKKTAKQKKKEKNKKALSLYVRNNQVSDFTKIPHEQKLTFLNTTPKDLIEYRKIGQIEIPYVPHEYCEKALNFVFNFNVSNEILREELRTEKYLKSVYKNNIKTGEKEMQKHIARVTVQFKFITPKKQEITRTVVSTHIGYENPATSDGDTLKAAVSKAWTVVARTFGIGADLKEAEKKAYSKVENEPPPPPAPPPKKAPVKKSPRPVPEWEK